MFFIWFILNLKKAITSKIKKDKSCFMLKNKLTISIQMVSILLLCMIFFMATVRAEDGYRLWLRYDQVSNASLLK